MFGRGFELFKLFGFSVRIDASWILIAILVVWSLASGFFPHYYGNLSRDTYWWMGVLGALGLFLSIVLHEFAHSWVARQRGMEMRGLHCLSSAGLPRWTTSRPVPAPNS